MLSRRRALGVAASMVLPSLTRGKPDTLEASNAVYVIAKDAGAVGDGVKDDRRALNAAATDNATLAFGPGMYRIASDWSVPASCSLVFFKGAALRVAAGATVTINSPFTAGLHRVFDTSTG